ncbi:hypothetical protein N7532_001439 [Penicillium argentinense]|uniref:Zn(2)-C6 fungal-type domain-containing protein n=1 Tax=Penicillium argentinense TaxID=1131581 RepID=A0A9W9G2G3_9EURO|nr:uncharacterized protein N7532_001439 [Penicillium argentinense]KAJ5110904.1 hypothetical protein N7532_001439 [Penicillium argentinense]
MAFRRSHRKSRHGCLNCKRRRVKCDEKRPACANCEQRHSTCVYSSAGPFAFADDSQRSSRRPRDQNRDRPTGSGSDVSNVRDHLDSATSSSSSPELNMQQIELVMQWVNQTHRLFARNEETRKVWEMPVLQEALQAPFLMHGILALSALHISHLKNDGVHSEWLNTAIAHKNTALAMFSEQLSNISQANAKAMMSFAGLAVAFSLASTLNLEKSGDGPSLGALTDIFTLSRGVRIVVNAEAEFLTQSNFAPLFDVTPPDVTIPDSFLDAFSRLDELVVECLGQPSGDQKRPYQRVISHLRDLAPFTFAEPTSLTVVAGWAIRAPAEYLEDLRNNNPLALVVLAHFCVFLHLARENWCVGSWGQIVLTQISQALAPDWQRHIDWALGQVST